MAFPAHHQDCDIYCGPACVMMMLQHAGVPVNGLYQSTLMSSIAVCHSQLSTTGVEPVSFGDIASPPMALALAASKELALSPRPNLSYEIYPPQSDPPPPTLTDDEVLLQIRSSLDDAAAPVFLLSQGGGHWILVCGRVGTGFRVRWPDNLGYAQGNQIPHQPGPCPLCKALHSSQKKIMTETGLLRIFPPVDRDVGNYKDQRLMLVPVLV